MSDPLFSDDAFRAGKIALNGLALRQEIIGQNLANVDTPDYRAQSVSFEDALRRALKDDTHIKLNTNHPMHLDRSNPEISFQVRPRAGGVLRADGNNVDIDVEMSQMVETGIRYQALTQAVSKKLLLLKTIATGR